MHLHGKTSPEPLPEAYLTSNRAWDHYMGKVWASVLPLTNFRPDGTVVEVAPGASAKIAHALSPLSFRGTLCLVEADPQASVQILEAYKTLLPHASIKLLDGLLRDKVMGLPHNPDLVLSNHPIDDMLLVEACRDSGFDALFEWAKSDAIQHTNVTTQTWAKLSSNQSLLQIAKQSVTQDWKDLVTALAPKSLIISQYASSALTHQGLQNLNDVSKELLLYLKSFFSPLVTDDDPVQKQLDQNLNYNNAYIGLEVLNAKNWLVMTQP